MAGGWKLSPETRARMSAARLGKKRPEVTKHGMSEHPMYHSWEGMKQRTTSGSSVHKRASSYADVRRDPRWDTFEGFLMYPPAGTWTQGAHLSRIGDRGDYTPENTRWRSNTANARESCETRGTMHVASDGRFAIDVARENGITPTCFWKRVRRGWSIDKACSEPMRTRGVS